MRLIENIKNWDEGDWFGGCLAFLLLGALVTSGIVGITALRADARVDHCYVQFVNASGVPHSDTYRVMGHIAWRSDAVLGNAENPEAAQELLHKVCPVGK